MTISISNDDFGRYADAERQLCDQAGPLLAAIFRDIESRAGVFITEVRVTLDRASNDGQEVSANCTIVNARPTLSFGHHDPADTKPSAGYSPSNQG
jgi:hypothetical protein